jgi:hypothetical protein
MSRLLLRHVVLPQLFLTAALLGGLRFVGADNEIRFVAPPLSTLMLAAFLVVLFARSGLLEVARDWLGEARSPLENASNALTLAALYAATVQVFNAVLPEDTLFNALFTLFFLMVFWNSMFAILRPERFVKSLGGLLVAAFVVKYLLLVALFEPSESLSKTVLQTLLRGVTLGGIESVPYARATGYTAFAAVALYLVGLWAASPPPDPQGELLYELLASRRRLTAADERRLLAALAPDGTGEAPEVIDAEIEEGSE